MTYVNNITHALIVIVLLLIQHPIFGQEHRCASDHMHKLLEQRDPSFQGRQQAYNHDIQEYLQTMAQHRSSEVYIIPVVFHIVHNYGIENISDSHIFEAVQILNRDFRKANADTSLIIAPFQSISADTRIEFRLAKLDPDGNCTNGIDRVQSLETYIGDDGAKLNPWPRHKYLNIWVVNDMANGVAGYAYYPEATMDLAMSTADGVIIRYDYIGTEQPSTENRSRALTHEIGHYLNLQHTWGDNNNPGEECGDDLVEDTPITKGFLDCQLNAEICTPGVIENAQNYMDYSYCSVMFTSGQRERMRATLENNIAFRNNLWSASNLAETGLMSNEQQLCVPLADFYPEKRMICLGNTITLYSIVQNASADTYLWEIDGGQSNNLTSPSIDVSWNTPGWKTITLTVSNATGTDTQTTYQSVFVSPEWSMHTGLYQETFEEDNSMNEYIVFNENHNASDWRRTDEIGYNSQHSVILDNYSVLPLLADDNDNDLDAFITPSFDLSSLSNGQLTFRYAMATRSTQMTDITDVLKLYSSKDCGKTWTLRKTIDELDLITAGSYAGYYLPQTDLQWIEGLYMIPSVLEDDNVRFKFEFESSSYANNLFIDNINISGTVGITENSKLNEWIIYPNPAQFSITMEWENYHPNPSRIELHNAFGQLVSTENIQNTKTVQLSIADLAAGIYYVTWIHPNGRSQRRLIVN